MLSVAEGNDDGPTGETVHAPRQGRNAEREPRDEEEKECASEWPATRTMKRSFARHESGRLWRNAFTQQVGSPTMQIATFD
jgi:hypothetical protein